MHVHEVVLTFENLQVIHSCFILASLKALGDSYIIVPKKNPYTVLFLSFPLLTNGK